MKLKKHLFSVSVGVGMLSVVMSCAGKSKTTSDTELRDLNDLSSAYAQQECPSTVTVTPKSGGLIVLNWEAYAPNTNTYVTMTVVPYAVGSTTNIATESNSTGSFTLYGYVAGLYTVYYTLQPASAQYASCSGMQKEVKFF